MRLLAVAIGLLLALLLIAIVCLIPAYLLMLLLGAFAHVSGFEQFALSYWASYLVITIIALLINVVGRS